ncbi:MAG: hypothetical protein HOH58_10220 [Opitutaceae bacterium]|nr:hypothetical protein [Opitutaceae bacterium]
MSPFTTILTHPGSAHKDDFLASCVLLAQSPAPIFRREPTPEDIADAGIVVVDVGDSHDPALNNFDHHHLPDDADPVCALSLVLKALDLYEDARSFCDWLEPAEWFDCRGANATAKFLNVPRDAVNQLYSPIDGTLLRCFAAGTHHVAGEPLWEMMRQVGLDLLNYLRSLRSRLTFIGKHAELWNLDASEDGPQVLFLPRTDPLPTEPSSGLDRYIVEQGLNDRVAATVSPDRRGVGYGLSRHRDNPAVDFTRLTDESDVHFAHKRGFVAKSSATDPQRLRELLQLARVG